MQIVVTLSEREYVLIKTFLESGMGNDAMRKICNGTILPKGHGDLIDVKELRQDIIAHKYSIDFCREHNIDQSIDVGMLNILLADATPVIKADKKGEEKI